MRERYLYHVTLTSGRVQQSPRSEVGDDVIAMLRPLLTRALRGEDVPVPHMPGYTVRGGVHGRCCLVTLFRAEAETRGEDGRPLQPPVLSIGVAPHSRCGAYLWRAMHQPLVPQAPPLATDPDAVPAEPWCADLIEIGAVLHPLDLSWTGDFSRCVAWTWIEMRGAAGVSDA